MAFKDVWPSTLAQAKKVLGNGAKINDSKAALVNKRDEEARKAIADFMAMVESLKSKLLAVKDAESKLKNAVAQAADEIVDDDYNLDSNKADDKKKIAQAQAIFKKFFDQAENAVDISIRNLDELDKHLANIAKYRRA